MDRHFTGRVFVCLLFLAILLAGAAAAEEARNVAADCTYTWIGGSDKNAEALYDGRRNNCWQSLKSRDTWLEVALPEGETCTGVQIRWSGINPDWCVETEQDGTWVAVDGYEQDLYVTWTPLDNVTKFRVSAHGKGASSLQICELEVYGAGERPASVQVWEPTPEKADLMIVAAHAGDEFLYFGGLIPYYEAEKGKDVVVVYLAQCTAEQQMELLDALWEAGHRTLPVLAQFYNRYTLKPEVLIERNGKNTVEYFMIEQFRKYQPMVVVTHDLNGENGNGMRKLAAQIVHTALERSGEAKWHKASSKTYGTWDVPKCYLHLYEEGQVVFDWKNLQLDAFGGRSAFDVADAAWMRYTTKTGSGGYEVFTDGPYNSQVFGLYRTTVGEDTAGNDLFENIPEREAEEADGQD